MDTGIFTTEPNRVSRVGNRLPWLTSLSLLRTIPEVAARIGAATGALEEAVEDRHQAAPRKSGRHEIVSAASLGSGGERRPACAAEIFSLFSRLDFQF